MSIATALEAVARCHRPGCCWTADGDAHAVDRAAIKHGKACKYATSVTVVDPTALGQRRTGAQA